MPASLAKPVIDQLRTTGKVERGWLGVQIQPVTPDISDSVGLDRARGAMVASVQPDSPAQKAGLRQGDVIVGFNGHPVDKLRDLTQAVANTAAGSRAEVSVWRDGREQRLSASIARLDPEKVATATDEDSADDPQSKLGLALAPLDREARREAGLAASVKGVLVTSVSPDSPAADKGIRPGDVIVKVGGRNVASPEDVANRVTAAQGEGRKSILLLVNRQGNERFVALPLGQA